MTTVSGLSGLGGIENSPRRAFRDSYRDWITRMCLSSPIDYSLSGTTTYWAKDDRDLAVNLHNDPTYDHNTFKDVTINMTASTDEVILVQGSANSTYNNGRHFCIDIFCYNFLLTQGTLQGQIGTDIFSDKSFTKTPDLNQYERGYARHANTVLIGSNSGTPIQGGGSWGSNADSTGPFYVGVQHKNALTEAQLFLTDQGPLNTKWAMDYSNGNEQKPVNRYQALEFVDMIDSKSADRGAFSSIAAFGGFGRNGATVPDLTSGPGCHLRIFALNQFKMTSNALIKNHGNLLATRGGGGGTVEIITNNFVVEGNVTDQINCQGGGATAASGGGGGGIFVYANKFTYQSAAQFRVSGRASTSTYGLKIGEGNNILETNKTWHDGFVRFYKIDKLDTVAT